MNLTCHKLKNNSHAQITPRYTWKIEKNKKREIFEIDRENPIYNQIFKTDRIKPEELIKICEIGVYLKKAKEKLHLNLNVKIDQYKKIEGDSYLFKLCHDLSLAEHSQKIILMFDHDNGEILRKLKEKTEQGKNYQNWGNNIYSFIIPVPDNRKDRDYFSIEFYFRDSEIIRKDENGRRLYFSNEFNEISGRHNQENLNCKDFNKIKSKIISVVDRDVFDAKNKNISLSKADFANNVLTNQKNFSDFDFSEFRKIFSIIEEIIKLN